MKIDTHAFKPESKELVIDIDMKVVPLLFLQ